MQVLNLPRSLRNQKSNTLLVGAISGPVKPGDVQLPILPLVDNLIDLAERGLWIDTPTGERRVRLHVVAFHMDNQGAAGGSVPRGGVVRLGRANGAAVRVFSFRHELLFEPQRCPSRCWLCGV
jgi:hypothetical protein